jgi:hypothetical protein
MKPKAPWGAVLKPFLPRTPGTVKVTLPKERPPKQKADAILPFCFDPS